MICLSNCEKSSMLNEILNIISTQPVKTQFKLWHYAFKREYNINSEEGLRRYKAFKENVKYIKETNDENLGFKVGLGPFTDITWEEFSKNFLTYKGQSTENEENRKLGYFDDMADKLDFEQGNHHHNDSVDEDNEYDNPIDKVSEDWSYLYDYVKDQNPCGSCWAFGAVGAVEAFTLKQGIKTKYSEQQLVDCTLLSSGCNGGTAYGAYKYMKEAGLMKLEDYPYTARDDPCKYDANKVALKIKSYRYCAGESFFCHNKMIMRFLKDGPYTSSFQAGKFMQHYRQGPIAPKKCSRQNHAIVVVKVDLEKRQIKIRNSWGEQWGENGYGWLKMDEHDGHLRGCGLLEEAYQVEKAEVVNN